MPLSATHTQMVAVDLAGMEVYQTQEGKPFPPAVSRQHAPQQRRDPTSVGSSNAVQSGFRAEYHTVRASPRGSAVQNPPIMWELQDMWVVRSLGGEEPLKEGMTAQSSILAWRISRPGETCGLQPMGSHRVRHDLARTHHTV